MTLIKHDINNRLHQMLS